MAPPDAYMKVDYKIRGTCRVQFPENHYEDQAGVKEADHWCSHMEGHLCHCHCNVTDIEIRWLRTSVHPKRCTCHGLCNSEMLGGYEVSFD